MVFTHCMILALRGNKVMRCKAASVLCATGSQMGDFSCLLQSNVQTAELCWHVGYGSCFQPLLHAPCH